MKEKLFIFIFLILLIAVLAGLNAATYVQKEKTPDNEFFPNRSTLNAGATGTRAFYSLLAESGRKVTRWTEPPAGLLTGNGPSVFVVVGSVRREFSEDEIAQLLRWVAADNRRLVLIDREPAEELVKTSSNWRVSVETGTNPEIMTVDPTDQKQMIGGMSAVKPVQPSPFTHSIIAVQPSRFAGVFHLERSDADAAGPTMGYIDDEDDFESADENGDSPPPPAGLENTSTDELAPVVHFGPDNNALVASVPYGKGTIVFLTDPYIVSNGGIALVDNAQLAINLVAAGSGTIAFDEYHQGYGSDTNQFLKFFQGTPVAAMFLQAIALIGLVLFSQSRRFARPVPETEPDRLSKLEYVTAMAELQNRSRAFDLAIENIYSDFRRRVTRHFGIDNFTASARDIAALIAERTGSERGAIERTLFACEEIIRGEPTDKQEVLRLTAELRTIEQGLNLTRSGRTRI